MFIYFSYNFDVFDKIEESFAIDYHRSNYNLQPIDNWDDEHCDELEAHPIVITGDTFIKGKNAQMKGMEVFNF